MMARARSETGVGWVVQCKLLTRAIRSALRTNTIHVRRMKMISNWFDRLDYDYMSSGLCILPTLPDNLQQSNVIHIIYIVAGQPFSNWILLLVALAIVKILFAEAKRQQQNIRGNSSSKAKTFPVCNKDKMKSGEKYGDISMASLQGIHCASFHNKFPRIHHIEWLQISIYLHFFQSTPSRIEYIYLVKLSHFKKYECAMRAIDCNSIPIASERAIERRLLVSDERK